MDGDGYPELCIAGQGVDDPVSWAGAAALFFGAWGGLEPRSETHLFISDAPSSRGLQAGPAARWVSGSVPSPSRRVAGHQSGER